jgi:hypothetical protein
MRQGHWASTPLPAHPSYNLRAPGGCIVSVQRLSATITVTPKGRIINSCTADYRIVFMLIMETQVSKLTCMLATATLFKLQTGLHCDREDYWCVIVTDGLHLGGEALFPDLGLKLNLVLFSVPGLYISPYLTRVYTWPCHYILLISFISCYG